MKNTYIMARTVFKIAEGPNLEAQTEGAAPKIDRQSAAKAVGETLAKDLNRSLADQPRSERLDNNDQAKKSPVLNDAQIGTLKTRGVNNVKVETGRDNRELTRLYFDDVDVSVCQGYIEGARTNLFTRYDSRKLGITHDDTDKVNITTSSRNEGGAKIDTTIVIVKNKNGSEDRVQLEKRTKS